MTKLGRFPMDAHCILGDDLYDVWDDFYRGGRIGEDTVDTFCRWLLTTQQGSIALERINNTPRQKFLPFDDERLARDPIVQAE